jgi:hypothetical protein
MSWFFGQPISVRGIFEVVANGPRLKEVGAFELKTSF